jgi:hypothetical protein
VKGGKVIRKQNDAFNERENTCVQATGISFLSEESLVALKTLIYLPLARLNSLPTWKANWP